MSLPFTESERAIFAYHNGKDKVFGDPLELERRVRFLLGNVNALVEKINAVDLNQADGIQLREALGAQEKLVNGVREAFSMPELDKKTGQGATEAMTLAVWSSFCEFLAQKKMIGGPPPTSSPHSRQSAAGLSPSILTTAPL